MKVFISGCHSGPNPSPGLGVARSLREAFPEAVLCAKDHSVQCSALHHPVFDEIWLSPSWQDLDLAEHAAELARRLDDDAVLVSGLDLEVVLLSKYAIKGALVPPESSVKRAAKPAIGCFTGLPKVDIPPWLVLPADPQDIDEFCRSNDWRVWVKGPAYGAKIVRSWGTAVEATRDFEEIWGRSGLFLQAHVRGEEVSVAFSAYRGRLLDAVFMEKRYVTEQGKTWAGAIRDPEPSLAAGLRDAVSSLEWTGGGELEFVRDDAGSLWLIDFNPRFPAWIYGATLSGRNLPANLVAAATGEPFVQQARRSRIFTRVVIELEASATAPLPMLRNQRADQVDAASGKHPSGMPLLQRRLAPAAPNALAVGTEYQAPWLDQLRAAAASTPTPLRWFLHAEAIARFARCRELKARLSQDAAVQIAYSVKTNPDPRLLALARDSGFLVEVISAEERRLVLESGFAAADIVYNGPVPLSKEGAPCKVFAAFADSLEALTRLSERAQGHLGPRVRPPGISSRFGIEVADPAEFASCIAALAKDQGQPLGISMHVQSSAIGLPRWRRAALATIEFAAAAAALCGRSATCLDIGGGWAYQDLEFVFTSLVPELFDTAQKALPKIDSLVLEPGKMLVEPLFVTAVRIIELRRRRLGNEAVVDGSVAELPMSILRPHRIVAVGSARAEWLGIGQDSVLGRLCIETDVLRANVALPAWIREGDLLIFENTGGYDTTMSYSFGKGTSHG